MGFKNTLLYWGMLDHCLEAGALHSNLHSPWPWACHLTFLVSSTHFLNARPSHSLVLWFFFMFLGFMILPNFSLGLSLLWFSWLSFSSSNLFFPSFEPLIWNPFKAESYSFGVFSLFLQAVRCVCLISWTLSLQLKLETYRSITDARISWSSRPEIAQVYCQRVCPETVHDRAVLTR